MPGLLRSGHGEPELPNVANGTNDPNTALPLGKHSRIRLIRGIRVIRQFQLLWLPRLPTQKKERGINFLAPRPSFLFRLMALPS